MKTFPHISIFFLLALLPACSPQETDSVNNSSLTALLEESDTKVSYDSVLGHLTWDSGDMIAIYAGSAYVDAEVTPSDGHVDFVETASAVRSHYAIYPAASAVASDYGESTLSVLLPATYDIEGKGADYSPTPMIAVNDPKESTLNFRHVGGLLRLTCYRVPAGTRTIKVTTDQYISGTYPVSNPGSALPTISSGAGSDHTKSVVFTVSASGLAGETDIVVNVPVPCGTYNSVTIGTYANATATGTPTTEAQATGTYVIARRYGVKVPFEDIGEYVLSVVQDPTDLYCYGGTSSSARVVSYRQNGGTVTPVAWESYEYYQDEACTIPYTGSLFPSAISGTGSSDPAGAVATFAYAASPVPANQSVSGTTLPSSNFGTGSSESNYYNLSNPDDMTSDYIKESANCYIVNGPGYYRIPLVMGCGVKNNAPRLNSRSYRGIDTSDPNAHPPVTDPRLLFKDYKGQHITNPYLHKSNSVAGSKPGTPTRAYVVWEDVNGLIKANTTSFNLDSPGENTAIVYDSDNDVYWLRFRVQGNTKGNAVIAVMDGTDTNAKVMWSYHIWVTDFVPWNYPGYESSLQKDIPVTNFQGYVYDMMPMYLGWVPSAVAGATVDTHSPQTVYVKLRQRDGGTGTAVMKVTQAAGITESDPGRGRAPYYQWGRKDAFWPGDWSGSPTPAAWQCYGKYPSFDNSSPPTLTYHNTQTTLDVAITTPHVIYGSGKIIPWDSESAEKRGGFNLWSAENDLALADAGGHNDNAIVKTIYDPCPAGYRVPPSNVFTGFTYSGNNVGDIEANAPYPRDPFSIEKIRVRGDWNYGWHFYTDARQNAVIFFADMGCRGFSGGITHSYGGNVWTGAPASYQSGYHLSFKETYVGPYRSPGGNSARNLGRVIRPVEDL